MAASSASAVLDYLHAPLVIIYFCVAYSFALCTLQKPYEKTENRRKRQVALHLTALLILTNIIQAVVFTSYSVKDNWGVAQHSVIRILGSTLAWSCLCVALSSQKQPIWHPYFGSWLVGGLIETVVLVFSATALETDQHWKAAVSLGTIRVLIFVALAVDGILLILASRVEKHTDEETQSLLGINGIANTSTNASAKANGNKTYGATKSVSSSDNDEDEPEDRDKDLKEKQRKRLEEEGGWLGYLKGFMILLPYLFPKNDWKGQVALVILGTNIILDRVLNVFIPRQIGIITNKLTESRVGPYKEVLIWGVMAWAKSFAGFAMIKSVASTYINNYSDARIADLAFGHVMDLSLDFHSNKDSGEVLRAVEQAHALNELVERIMLDISPVLLDLCVALWYVTHLFDVYVAFSILTIGIVYVWSGISLTNWAQPKRRIYVDKSRKESKTVYESVSNWQTVAYFNRGDYERKRYAGAVGTTINAQWWYLLRSYTNYGIQALLIEVGFCGVVFLAIWEIVNSNKPVGNFVTLILYWETMINPLYTIAYSYRHIASSLIDAERLLQLLQTKATVTNKDQAKTLQVSKGRVEFKDVMFSYDERKDVLKNINFVAEPGKTIAFVGETGGGKSTMLKLLFRFYDVTGGSITIDGQDLRDVTISSLRDALGVVPQDPALFNQSIMENIRYSRLDASEDEIKEACKSAAVHDKIETFPDKYKSKVGERGVKLSGGELQRVAIARVLIKDPRIVLLDEATSAVDSTTEAQIQLAFRKLSAGRTTFVVAHRLSTIMEADMILVVDHGEIIERGTHEELLLKGGKYLELWTKQTDKPTKIKSSSVEDVEEVSIKDISDTKYSQELAKSLGDLKSDDSEEQIPASSASGEDESATVATGKESGPLIDLTPEGHEYGSSTSRKDDQT